MCTNYIWYLVNFFNPRLRASSTTLRSRFSITLVLGGCTDLLPYPFHLFGLWQVFAAMGAKWLLVLSLLFFYMTQFWSFLVDHGSSLEIASDLGTRSKLWTWTCGSGCSASSKPWKWTWDLFISDSINCGNEHGVVHRLHRSRGNENEVFCLWLHWSCGNEHAVIYFLTHSRMLGFHQYYSNYCDVRSKAYSKFSPSSLERWGVTCQVLPRSFRACPTQVPWWRCQPTHHSYRHARWIYL